MKKILLLTGLLLSAWETYAGKPGTRKPADTACLFSMFRSQQPIFYEFSNELNGPEVKREIMRGSVLLSKQDKFYRIADSTQEQIIGIDAMAFLDHRARRIRLMKFENDTSRRISFEHFTHSTFSDSDMRLLLMKSKLEAYEGNTQKGDSLFIAPPPGAPMSEIRMVMKRQSCVPEHMETKSYLQKAGNTPSSSDAFYKGHTWNYQTGIPENYKNLFENRFQIAQYLQNTYPQYKIVNL